MKKTTAKKLPLRTQTVAALTGTDLRAVAGASLTNVSLTTQLQHGWTTIMSNAAWTTIVI